MALVTVELRNLLKTDFELFDFEYSFDDVNMKAEIEEAIINHFYFHEIGTYSPDRFKHIFKTKFLSAIEYYNKLYNTSLLEYNPLINYSMTEALERLANTSATSTSIGSDETQTTSKDNTENQTTTNTQTDTDTNSTQLGTDQTSDYPQDDFTGDYRNASGENEVTREQSDVTTATQTTQGTSEGQTSSTGTGTSNTQQDSSSDNIETYEKTIEGMTGRTYQELIQLERDSIMRIKAMIIAELKPCFLLTYN